MLLVCCWCVVGKCVVGKVGKVCCWCVVGYSVLLVSVLLVSMLLVSVCTSPATEMMRTIKLHTYQFCHCLAISYVSILSSTM